MDQTLWAFTSILFQSFDKLALVGGNFPGFFNWLVFVVKLHGTAIDSYKTKTVFLKELLKNRNVPAFAKGRPIKLNRTLGLENNLIDQNKTLNEKKTTPDVER